MYGGWERSRFAQDTRWAIFERLLDVVGVHRTGRAAGRVSAPTACPGAWVLVRIADWVDAAARPVDEPRFQKMLDPEHGAMSEVLADLCTLTGERRCSRHLPKGRWCST